MPVDEFAHVAPVDLLEYRLDVDTVRDSGAQDNV
jgi:hypothetical protein